MNRDSLYTFVTSLLDGFLLDETLFESLLDISQSNREGARPWVILRTQDATQTASTGDTFLTAKTLPADFKKTYARSAIVLVDGQGNVINRLRQIPIHERNRYKDDNSKFYINYATKQFFLCGTQAQSATINLYYIKKTTKVSAASSNTWDFDAYDDAYSKVLALDVAVMHKWGIDYDQINAVQADKNYMLATALFENMADWDTELAQNSQEGVDMNNNGASYSTEMGGHVGNLIG